MWIYLLMITLVILLAIPFIFIHRDRVPSSPLTGIETGTVSRGICYQRYFNGDPGLAGDMAANANWSQIAPRRDDLELFKNMNVEVIRLYEWNYKVDHNLFVNDVYNKGLKFQLPISNYVMGFQGAPYDVANFYNATLPQITEGNRYKRCVHSIAISNEPFLSFGEDSLPLIDKAINDILAVERAQQITGPLPPITVPCAFANINNEGPGIYYARRLNELPSVQGLGDRFIYSINTTNSADSIKNEFADRYQRPFMITEWGLSPQNYPDGKYAEALKRETEKILRYGREGSIQLVAIFGFLYFKQVQKSGSELNYGFTCFPEYQNISNCLDSQTCPPHGAELGIYSQDNSLLALAEAYGGSVTGIPLGTCLPLAIIR